MISPSVSTWQKAAFGAAGLLAIGVVFGHLNPWTVALPCGAMAVTLGGLRVAVARSGRELQDQRAEAEVERRHLNNVQEELRKLNSILRTRETELLEAVGHVEMSREAYRIASIRFEELFAGFPVPTFSYDATGAIYEWNRAAELLTGIEAKDAFGRDVADVFVASPDFVDFHREIRRVFDGDPVSGVGRRMNLGEGGTRHLVCNSFPLRTVGRKISGGVTALLDVTGHVAAELKFRTLFDQGSDAYLVLSRTGTVLDANLQARLLLGGSAEIDLTGRPMADFLLPEDRRAHALFLRKAIRREIAREEWMLHALDGTSVEAEVAISGANLDGAGGGGDAVVLMQIHDLGERKRFECELQGAVTELERAQAIGGIGSWELDLKTGVFTWSQEMYRVCGWAEDMEIPSAREFVRLAHPDDSALLMDALRGATADGERRQIQHRLVRRDGTVGHAVSSFYPLIEEGRIVGTVQDVTERRREEMRVVESEAKLRTVLEAVDAGLLVVTSDFRVVLQNPSVVRLFGLPEGTVLECISPDGSVLDADGEPLPFEARPVVRALREGTSTRNEVLGYKRPDGKVVWLSFSAAPVRIPGQESVGSAIVTFSDVTAQLEHQTQLKDQMDLSHGLARDLKDKNRELRSVNARLKTLATTDGLTGLSNHRTFQEYLESCCAKSAGQVSLLMLDVDRFKDFNDTFGHRVGDDVLRGVAGILRESCRTGDMAARYGGEEFVLVLPRTGEAQAREIAERVRSAVEDGAWTHRGVTVSVGVETRTEGQHPHDMIEKADAALYTSKRSGRNRTTHASDLMVQREAA